MRQSYLKNAALLTVSDVGLRLAGMGLRIYLANALGGEGMGLYQLVLAVYSLFVTLATSGVSVASTRLMAEELTGSPARAKGMLLRLCGMAAALGGAAMGAQWILAEPAARWWLGDARAAAALRAGAFGMPFMAVAAVVTLTVFTFKFVEEIGLLQCLFVGVGMASLIALVAVTVWHGLAAYRN